jgi:cytochrome b561
VSTTAYDPLVKLLHWAVAGLIVVQFVLAKLVDSAGDAAELRQLALLANHQSVGITILLFAVARLGLRLRQAPLQPLPVPEWQQTAAEISHWLLYALLFLLPITGWLMSSASANSVVWFNLVQIPDLVAEDPQLQEVLEEVHATFAKLLLLLAAIHVLAAIKHSLFGKSGAMERISSVAGIVAFVVVIVLGVYALGRVAV